MSRVKKALRSQGGFTLIELLIVVVILGILAAIAIPQIAGLVGQADLSQIESNIRTLMTDLEAERARSDDRTFPVAETWDEDDAMNEMDFSGAIESLDENYDGGEGVIKTIEGNAGTDENHLSTANEYSITFTISSDIIDDSDNDLEITIADGNLTRTTD